MSRHRANSDRVNTVRAAVAVALLVGFYGYTLGIVVALGALTVVLVGFGFSSLVGKLALVTLGLAGATGYATWKVLRASPDPAPGLVLPEQGAPRLWAEVRAIATRVGTRPPDEIRLVAEVNAAVSEDTKLLGLRSGRRHLYLGVPLLQAMTMAQVRSVLAHELGHYSHRHTALGALAYRGREAIVRTILHVGPSSVTGWLLRGYAVVYRLASAAVSRAQEVEADRASVRVAGKQAAADALRELPGLSAAWRFYLDSYVAWGLESGFAPAQVLEKFPTLLAARADELARLRAEGPPEDRSAWDTHPPVAERVALIGDEPEAHVAVDDRPAALLIGDLPVAAAELEKLVIDFGDRTLVPFEEYSAAAAHWHTRQDADMLYRAAGRITGSAHTNLDGVLRMLHDGHRDELHRALVTTTQQAEPPPAEELLAHHVGAAIATAAVDSGLARWHHSWTTPARLVDLADNPVPIHEHGMHAVSGQAAQMRDWLTRWGVDVAAATVAQTTASAARAQPLAAIVNAKVDGSRRDLVLLTSGLVVIPGIARLKMRQAKPRLQRMLADVSPEELATTPGNRFIAYEEIATGAVIRKLPATFQFVLHSGTRVKIRWGVESEELGPGWETLGRTVGTLRAQASSANRAA